MPVVRTVVYWCERCGETKTYTDRLERLLGAGGPADCATSPEGFVT